MFYYLSFVVGPLLHALKLWGGGGRLPIEFKCQPLGTFWVFDLLGTWLGLGLGGLHPGAMA